MRLLLTTASIALLLAASASSLAAQHDSSAARLPDLVVTSTRVPLPPEAVSASVTVLTGSELRERGITLVADALRDVPGAAVVRTGGPGGPTSLFLRGGESDYVKVLIDGVPVNRAGGAFDFANLTTDDVDRIEVVRGPASVLYGSDAVTGVVQIFTRRGRGPVRATASTEAGSFGTARWSLGSAGGSDRAGYSASLSRLTTDGIYRFNSAYRSTAANVLGRWRPDGRSDLTAAFRYGSAVDHFPTDFTGTPTDHNQHTDERLIVGGLDGGRQLTDRLELRAQFGLSELRTDYVNPPDVPGGDSTPPSRLTDRRTTGDLRVNYRPAPTVTLTGGGSLERLTGISDRSARRTTAGGYLQALVEPVAGLMLNLNARADDDDAFGGFVTWRAGAAYHLGGGLRVRGSAGRAYKAPTFSELYARSAFEVGNPSLTPERSFTWEVGADQTVLAGRLMLGVTWFDQRFRDLIQYAFESAEQPSYRNIAAARSRGLDLQGTAALTRAVRLTAAYTWVHSEVTDPGVSRSPSFAQGERLLRRPTDSGRIGLRIAPTARITVSTDLRLVGSRDDVDFRTFPERRVTLPGYALTDLAVSAVLPVRRWGLPGVTVTARAENLFDRDYQPVFGYAAPGRALFVGGQLEL